MSLRFLTAGESHGPGLVAIVEGLPAGVPVSVERFATELARRRMGAGRGRRMAIETDEIEILGGVRFGVTLGGPVAVVVHNTEWPKWTTEMSSESGESTRPLTTPRPGHADLAGMLKYDTYDARDILERSSARETAARTIAGVLAKTYLEALGITVLSHVVAIGPIAVSPAAPPGPDARERIDSSPVRTLDAAAEPLMLGEIARAHEARDTLGGVVEVVVHGVPTGIGSHVHWDRKIDALLAAALMSIPSVKGVEIGHAFDIAATPGSAAHDEIGFDATGFVRDTNRAGGLEGGMTTGQPVVLRAAMKPISTLMRALRTVDVLTKEPAEAFRERSDVCSVPAGGVVAEQMVAFVVADEVARVLGGDTMDDVVARMRAYRDRLAAY
jgi:chorismate synthase